MARWQRQVAAGVDDKRLHNQLYPLQTGSKRYGQCGVEISDWFPHIGGCADDIAFIRGMWTTDNNHGAQVQFASGRHMLEPRTAAPGVDAANFGFDVTPARYVTGIITERGISDANEAAIRALYPEFAETSGRLGRRER